MIRCSGDGEAQPVTLTHQGQQSSRLSDQYVSGLTGAVQVVAFAPPCPNATGPDIKLKFSNSWTEPRWRCRILVNGNTPHQIVLSNGSANALQDCGFGAQQVIRAGILSAVWLPSYLTR
jgi:hypothetical protein